MEGYTVNTTLLRKICEMMKFPTRNTTMSIDQTREKKSVAVENASYTDLETF